MGFAPGPGAVTNGAMMSPLGSLNTPLQLFGKSGASPVHDPSQGLAQEPDLLDDLQAAHGVQLGAHHRAAEGRAADGGGVRLHPAGPHADLPADHDRAPRDPLPVTTG